MTPDVKGPYLQVAVLCEKVIEDKQGPMSLIGIAEQVTIEAEGADPPLQMPKGTITTTAVFTLRSGQAPGSHTLALTLESPSGKKGQTFDVPVLLPDDPWRGTNIVVPIVLTIEEEGTYWFQVSLDNSFLTKVPLRVIYVRRVSKRGTLPAN